MTHIKLNLSCPVGLGEQVAEYLLASEWLEGGFTTIAGQGHGHDFSQASLREKVRGHVQTQQIFAILPEENLAPLLEALRARFRTPHMTYWTEPVHAFGDFA
ncbi:MAG TPA: DUF3240 family protein [Rhizomicrobium sp.]|jgi:hypothetical protein|nr:DUF3240 family protein [Rhizomicrobium sp.]